MPMEINPRRAFERMFGQGGNASTRAARREQDRSILDALTEQASDLQSALGTSDRTTLNSYLENVREIERRLDRASAQLDDPDLELPDAPAGIPFVYEDHVETMFDLLKLAFQADITRVFTFMMAREVSNRTYNQVGVSDGHHALSHHQNREEKMSNNVLIQNYHVTLFSRFLEKLQSTRDGDGSLLDNSILLYGSNMSNSNAHDHFPLPNVVVGGGRGRLAGGQHLRYPDHTPMTNLLLTLAHKAGVTAGELGDSTGTIAEL
jgi:hypothetical protein